nr:GNAT family N-acetyltransferase [Candidatus Aminicenantes bacterium]NIM83594.1 GNAT family N-acetyltransferase [Candidatus Aminicenantes bacterium]NIN22998.1 GNAT family N-acetyltransferase [Candidatus Aminicenantes bacterium]NIN46735.1 GNAT family N-acetyltransferase [Candidatus Aminicenantes bacterium]NIN89641.1 GNAT family N-acetyltransferase [Candidatus Aminicenantes bacterium]
LPASIKRWKKKYPEKFAPEEVIFKNIRRGNRIFISTACGEPQYLVSALINYVESNPKAFADTEIFHIWTLGLAPYADVKYTYNFRHNSFFIGNNTRSSINAGLADYTPIFLSQVPGLLNSKRIPIDVALIQTSLPDRSGFVSLGISVDITKTAIANASIIIAQTNTHMPRVHGNTFINIKNIDYILHHDEKILEFSPTVPDEIAQQIGKHVSRIVNDGDTIQLGYGSVPNAILHHLKNKKHLGVHTELLTDSLVELVKEGVVDNSRKNLDNGKSVASFCMGVEETYKYIDDNPLFEFQPMDYTNDPLMISRINNMTAINSALQVDLTGQASAESIGHTFYSGIGGSADFMRGTVLAPGGKTILVLQTTARDGDVSRIVPFLDTGAGVTLNRGDVHYIVTEYGVAYIHGKNIRERAMDIIAITHPKFRPWLVEEARKYNIIYKDQAFIPGKKGEYPEYLETYRTTKTGLNILLRPVRINDEGLIKDLFYSLSDQSLRRRFMSPRTDVPHKLRQEFVIIDYSEKMVVLATIEKEGKEIALGMGQYIKDSSTNTAEAAFTVREDYHGQGIATEILKYLVLLAKNDGLHGFTAEVLFENRPMMRVFEKMEFDIQRTIDGNSYSIFLNFEEKQKMNGE